MLGTVGKAVRFSQRLSKPVFDPIAVTKHMVQGVRLYGSFLRDLRRFNRLDTGSPARLRDLTPHLFNKGSGHKIDPHYLYQSAWAFRRINESNVEEHVDVGSESKFVAILSAVVDVTFVDLRALDVEVESLHSKVGDILSLPYPDRSVASLSSLHVIEHIGLGRYGDPIDPDGTRKAAKELLRVLAPEGNLYVSLPIGAHRVCFNAHRVHSTASVLEMFNGLELVEFSAVSDAGSFTRNADLDAFDEARYSCGLFWFRGAA